MQKRFVTAVFISIVIIFSISFSLPAREQNSLIVGGKNFSEGFIISEIFAQLIEKKMGITVERRFGLGGTYICFEAMRKGEIDLYPEYTGTALIALMKRETPGNPDKVYSVVKEYFRKKGLVFLEPLGFNNSYTLTMPAGKAEKLGIRKISDLVPHAPGLDFYCTHEFIERPDGLNGIAGFYGLKFKSVNGMDPGLTYLAARQGKADVIDGFSTDGRIPAFNLMILEDDRHFFPPYHAAPFIREDALKKFPDVEKVLNGLARTISDADMQKMNYQVDQLGLSYGEVAANFLSRRGLLSGHKPEPEAPDSLWNLLLLRKGDIFLHTIQHVKLTAIAVILAILIAVPLGILMSRFGKLAGPVMQIVNVIQTLPSLALLGFMVPLFGIGVVPAIIALFLYALLPIVSNTYTGLKQVDPLLIEAARGMGMKDYQILCKVEIPLALNVIMAGIRTSTVLNIGTATLAAFVGAGGLGAFILRGIAMSNNNLILAGAIPVSILAIIGDRLLKGIESTVMPRGVKR
ncbi:MAG: glycine betaine ABC transporter substrate-binding protein [Vulcanimicrobiota bacterium]